MQFAPLQSLQLPEILRRRQLQCGNRGVEVTMFLLQAHELGPEINVVLVVHGASVVTR